MKKCGVIYDEIYSKHQTQLMYGHPENKKRVLNTIKVLEENGLYGENRDEHFVDMLPSKASLDKIKWIHSKELVSEVEKKVEIAKGPYGMATMDPDTMISKKSLEAACYAVGGNFTAIDSIFSGKIDRAFVLCRPPGHHANAGRSRGFCIFNNIILAAQYLFKEKNLDRVAIYDFDVHAGNGSEDIIYKGVPGFPNKELLFISSHRDPRTFYPFECFIDDIGEGKQKGKIANITFTSGSGDESMKSVLNNIVKPMLNEFKPEYLLISAGFDGHFSDPIGDLNFTAQGFGNIINELKPIADEYSKGRMHATLEGGYNIDALGRSIANVISCLSDGKNLFEDDEKGDNRIDFTQNSLIPAIKDKLSQYWRCFNNL